MISVEDVVQDPDFAAPQPFTILRSTGAWVAGGFQSTTVPIQLFGPVQQASNKEIAMLPEGDRIGAVRSFHATQPIYTTRGYAPAPSVHGEIPQGSGTVFVLSSAPPADAGQLTINGLLQTPDVDYWVTNSVLTLSVAATANAVLWFQWPVTAYDQPVASDIITYGGESYRVLSVYHDPGCGYWKSLATRMNAA